MKKEYVAYVLTWTESEAGWGQRPDGFSLHETQEDVKAYIDAYWAQEREYNRTHGITGTPECYSRPDGSSGQIAIVSRKAAKALREATAAGKHGLRLYQRSEFEPDKK